MAGCVYFKLFIIVYYNRDSNNILGFQPKFSCLDWLMLLLKITRINKDRCASEVWHWNLGVGKTKRMALDISKKKCIPVR